MTDFEKMVNDAITAALSKPLTEKQKATGTQAVMRWLTDRAAKRSVPDLAQRLEAFQKEVERMVEDAKLAIEKGKLVVKVNGSAEDTLKRLRLGTSWFVGNDDIGEVVLAGVLEEK